MSLDKARRQVKTAFFISTAIGIIIILMFLSSEEDKYSVLIMLLPMAGYIIYGNQLAEKHKYMSEFADSVYFLGFSFTLLALLGATIFEKLSADPVKTISYFGMALATTILGLMYRNYHMQFTDLNVDPLEKAKKQLEDEVHNFIIMSDSLQEGMAAIKDNFENSSEMLSVLMPKKIEESINAIDGQLYNSFSSLEKNIEAMDDLYSSILEKTRSRYEGLDAISSQSLKRTLGMFDSVSDKVQSSTRRISTSLEGSAEETEKINSTLNEFNQTIINSGDKKGLLDESLKSIEIITKELKGFSKSVTSLNKAYLKNTKELEATSKMIRKEVDQIEIIFKDVESLVKKKFE